jgi:hypothetical protein
MDGYCLNTILDYFIGLLISSRIEEKNKINL